MENKKLQVFDPPMCCSTGVCGPDVNPELVQFASNLVWLQKQSILVERFNLSSNPGVFADNTLVSETLKKEGNECLPLILVDGLIVSRGIYPSIKELAGFTGIDYTGETAPIIMQTITESGKQNSESVCGPGCDCHAPSSGNRTKVIAGLIIALFAVSVFAYKLIKNKPVSESVGTYAAEADKNNSATLTPVVEKTNDPAVTSNQTTKKMYIGKYLDSMNSLNTVAIDQDAVFILIPGKEDRAVKKETETAMLGAQSTLKTNKINAGLYTLRTSAPDYAGISAQITPPAIIVACKGRGMNAVPGTDISETKLVQAFVAVSQAGGCGSGSSCGPSSSGCK